MNIIHAQFFGGWNGDLPVDAFINGRRIYHGVPVHGEELPPYEVNADAVTCEVYHAGHPLPVQEPNSFSIAEDHWIRMSWDGHQIKVEERSAPFEINDIPPGRGTREI